MSEGQGNQGGAQSFEATAIPAEFQKGSISSFKTVGDVLKGYDNLSSKLGSRNMADFDAPKDEAGRRAVLAKVGYEIPAKPEDYGLKYPDGMTNGNPERLKWIAETAHKNNISKQAAAGLFNDLLAQDKSLLDGYNQRREGERTRATEQLKKDWGADFEKNQGRVNKALELVKTEATRKEVQDLVSRHPELSELFKGMGHAMESGTYRPGGGSIQTPNTLQELQGERFKIEKEMQDMQAKGRVDTASQQWQSLVARRQEALAKESKAATEAKGAA